MCQLHSELFSLQLFDYIDLLFLLIIQKQIAQLRYLLVIQFVERSHDVLAICLVDDVFNGEGSLYYELLFLLHILQLLSLWIPTD